MPPGMFSQVTSHQKRYCNVEQLHFILVHISHSLASRDRQERNWNIIFCQKHYQVQDTGTCASVELLLHLTRTTPASQYLNHSLITPLNEVSDASANSKPLQTFCQRVNSLVAELSSYCAVTPLQIPPVFTPSDHKNLNINYRWSLALSRPGILNIAGPLHSRHPAVLSNEIPIGKQ